MNDQPISGLVRSASGQNPAQKPPGMDPQMGQMPGQQPLGVGDLVNQPQGGPPKQLTMDHVLSLLHHMRSFNKAFAPILKDDSLGTKNIRPKVFEAAAQLMGEKVLNLSQVMNAVKTLPDDPFEQKKWLLNIVRMNEMVQDRVVEQYGQNENWMDDAAQSTFDPRDHGKHIQGLVDRYA